VTTVGRNEVTPKQGECLGDDPIDVRSVVMSAPTAPLHCRSMKPGEMTRPPQSTIPQPGRAVADRRNGTPVDGEVAAREMPVDQQLSAANTT